MRIGSRTKYCFAFTTGRSGTQLLAAALNLCTQCFADHEPKPVLNHQALKCLVNGNWGSGTLVTLKSWQIRRCRKSSGAKIYGDISHLFSKYGVRIVSRLGPQRCLIVRLTRNPIDVIQSFGALGTIPYFTKTGNHSVGNPLWPGSRLQFTPATHCKALAWHILETELRYREFIATHPDGDLISLSFETLCDQEQLAEWLRELGFIWSGRDGVTVRRMNAKASKKANAINIDEAVSAFKRVSEMAGLDWVEKDRALSL